MRRARSYSIVDHALYHGGYLHRLSHEAMALYLFLVVVGDREGRSFYGEATLLEILRLNEAALGAARSALLDEGLIAWRRPYWWVRSLSGSPAGGAPLARPHAPRSEVAASLESVVAAAAEQPVERETARSRFRELLEALASAPSEARRREER